VLSFNSEEGRAISMARFSLLPREDQYFSYFSQMTSYIYDAANLLVEMLGKDGNDLGTYVQQIKSIEHACDNLTHTVSTSLNKTFITPFDREDIYMLSGALDDVVDLIDEAARAVVMYDVRGMTQHSRNFAKVIQAMSVQLHEIVKTLSKPTNITARLVELHRLENEGDDIYHTAIGDLFRRETDPLTVLKWKEIYEKLEAAVDRCENVANIIESVIIKHT
jgi:predicted phosphate transport protein (TIGR00153 family)